MVALALLLARGRIGEDEATGSAAIMLAAELGRDADDPPGPRARCSTPRPLGDGRAEVGGRVVLDEVQRLLALSARERVRPG